jgi:hypothetical protein
LHSLRMTAQERLKLALFVKFGKTAELKVVVGKTASDGDAQSLCHDAPRRPLKPSSAWGCRPARREVGKADSSGSRGASNAWPGAKCAEVARHVRAWRALHAALQRGMRALLVRRGREATASVAETGLRGEAISFACRGARPTPNGPRE